MAHQRHWQLGGPGQAVIETPDPYHVGFPGIALCIVNRHNNQIDAMQAEIDALKRRDVDKWHQAGTEAIAAQFVTGCRGAMDRVVLGESPVETTRRQLIGSLVDLPQSSLGGLSLREAVTFIMEGGGK